MARRDPMKLKTTNVPLELYDFARKWLTLLSLAIMLVLFLINAPFGRFAGNNHRRGRHPVGLFNSSLFLVDGIRSWIVMEMVAPLTFIYALFKSPLSFYKVPLPDAFSPQGVLIILFLIHYANRALINPLRTPSRSTSHLIVPLAGIIFNLANGYIMGSYLSSPYGRIYLGGQWAFERTSFRVGVLLWLVGFVGNVAHDEILLQLRRRAAERKAKDEKEVEDDDSKNKEKEATVTKKAAAGEYYGIPSGLLYEFISYPNYFCEWIEWTGFALAAAPFPIPIDASSVSTFQSSILSALRTIASPWTWKNALLTPPYAFAPTLPPPWVFVLAEIALMLPRAYKGHLWYKERFGERYPKGRKAVIPFVF
ncbi:hypothetical protein H1R20_g11154, partial [Candolleomyces eurysporus]